MRRPTRIILVCCVLLSVAAHAYAGDAVREWNQLALSLTLTATPSQAPVQQTRTLAIVQVAVHDAVNAITGEYTTYSSPGPAPAGASPEAGAIGAAYEALAALFPSQLAALDSAYATSLATNHVAPTDPGLDFGKAVANAIVALRSADRADQAQYDLTVPGAGTPGVWIRLNNAPAQLPGWGAVTPWVLRSGDQFRPDAPPALTSDRYATDLNEVMQIGERTSPLRTSEQTSIANFWRGSPAAIWNPVLAQVLDASGLNLSATARAFALMYLAAADASIGCWDAKYTYFFWRPQLAIAGADLDGNPATSAPATQWLPLLPTPPHPEYPSGHACNSAAMAAVLEGVFGDDPGVVLSVTLSGITRQWDTFEQGVQEVIDARVYSGIHYRNSDETGARLGRQVAQFVMTHALRPPTGTWKR